MHVYCMHMHMHMHMYKTTDGKVRVHACVLHAHAHAHTHVYKTTDGKVRHACMCTCTHAPACICTRAPTSISITRPRHICICIYTYIQAVNFLSSDTPKTYMDMCICMQVLNFLSSDTPKTAAEAAVVVAECHVSWQGLKARGVGATGFWLG